MSPIVLVVEDTELLRRMYADRLVEDGFRVLLASDGLEALSTLRTETPDLILLDLVMPRMGGIEFLDTLKRDPRLQDIPVLVLSNLGQESDVERGLELGAVDYLIKNDSRPADISERITEVLAELGGGIPERRGFHILVRDREADADALLQQSGLPRRLWCPACEIELSLEMVPQTERLGWYDAHFVCRGCGREF